MYERYKVLEHLDPLTDDQLEQALFVGPEFSDRPFSDFVDAQVAKFDTKIAEIDAASEHPTMLATLNSRLIGCLLTGQEEELKNLYPYWVGEPDTHLAAEIGYE